VPKSRQLSISHVRLCILRTIAHPGKGWFTLLRLFGPLQPWFDKAWRPGEIEKID
jgi:hypothetical protein